MRGVFSVVCVSLLLPSCSERVQFREADLGGMAGTALVLDGRGGVVQSILHPDVASKRALIAANATRLATLLVSVEKGQVDPGGSFVCRPPCEGNHGTMRPREALALSCRSVFREMQRKVPWREMEEYLRAFGFGVPTGQGGPDEAAGSLPRFLEGEEAWDLWMHPVISITPLQIANFFSRLVRRDLPLRRETMDLVVQILEDGSQRKREAFGGHGRSTPVLTGSYRDRTFAYAWAAAELRSERQHVTALLFLLGMPDTVDERTATELLARWWGHQATEGA